MSGIEGGGSAYSLCDLSKPGLEGALTLSRRRIESRLTQRGFVDAYGGCISTMMARLEMELSRVEETEADPTAVSEIMATLGSEADNQAAWAQSMLDHLQPDRVAALLK